MSRAAAHTYIPSHWEIGAVIGVNFALVLFEWVTIRKYTDSLLAAAGAPEGHRRALLT
jgi:hypothetical protein